VEMWHDRATTAARCSGGARAVIALGAKALEPSLPRGAKETDRSLFDGPGRSARHVERRRSRGAPLRRWRKETDRSLLVAHITSPSRAERPKRARSVSSSARG